MTTSLIHSRRRPANFAKRLRSSRNNDARSVWLYRQIECVWSAATEYFDYSARVFVRDRFRRDP